MASENTLIVLLAILSLGLIIPELLKKFRLPFITLIILIGAIVGPNGFNYVQSNEIIAFFGFLGMSFLMLMAGMETNLGLLKESKNKIFTMAFLNGAIPCFVGIAITYFFGYPLLTSLLVGIVFISSSVAIIAPSLKELKLFEKGTGHLMLSAVLIADIVSLVLLGVIFQGIEQTSFLPLPVHFLLLFLSIAILLKFLPKFSSYILEKHLADHESKSPNKMYERPLHFLMALLIATLAYFSIFGVHPILAAFLTGLALSGVIVSDKTNILYAKLHTLGYGIFIPVFFFIIGMEMDLFLLAQFELTNLLLVSLVFGLILSKFFSGYIAGKVVGFKKKESVIFGSISITQLTTTLAVTYAAAALGVFDSSLVTALILLSILTTFIGPILTSYFNEKQLK